MGTLKERHETDKDANTQSPITPARIESIISILQPLTLSGTGYSNSNTFPQNGNIQLIPQSFTYSANLSSAVSSAVQGTYNLDNGDVKYF